METENALTVFEPLKAKITTLADECRNIVISDEDSLERAKDHAKAAKKISTTIDEKREEAKKPYLEGGRRIDALAKSLTAELDAGTKTLREQIRNFELKKEQARQAELARIAAEKAKIEKEQEELRKKMEEENPGSIDVLMPMVDTIRLDVAAAALKEEKSPLKKVWTYKITDELQIPRLYLSVDDKKIKGAIQSGLRDIPGLEIFQDSQLVLR
jgi:vancomycin resistance protein YoaR